MPASFGQPPRQDISSSDSFKASNNVDSDSTSIFKKKELSPPDVKPCFKRIKCKSESRYDHENSRPADNGTLDSSYQTETIVPGKFLFCSHVEYNNHLISLYRKISSTSSLRRSVSIGAIENQIPAKADISAVSKPISQRKLSSEFKKQKHHTPAPRKKSSSNSKSICETRSNCEKLCSRKSQNTERKNSKGESPADISDEMHDGTSNESSRYNEDALKDGRCQVERETSFCVSTNNGNEEQSDSSAVTCEKVSKKTRNAMSRRSQSCKSMQKRSSHLFNISKYLRDTQRSKSFATTREFSTHDSKDMIRMCDGRLIAHHDQKHRKDTELTPIKTTRSFDVNDTDSRGNSCLHHASSKGDISTIKYLLAQGGDVWVKNDDQCLPVDLAQNFQTAKLLSSATLFYSEQNEQRNERNIIQTSKLNISL